MNDTLLANLHVNERLIATINPGVVSRTSDKVQSCVVRAVDTETFDEVWFQVEKPDKSTWWVPVSEIKSFLVITKNPTVLD